MSRKKANTDRLLREGLNKHLRLERFDSLSDLIVSLEGNKPVRGFVLRPKGNDVRFRIQDRFDVIIDGLIVDTLLGSVGLVHVFDGTGDSAKSIRDTVGEALEHAAYFRHMLGDVCRVDQRVPTVEVGLVLSDAYADSMGDVVGELVRESPFLETVGIGKLRDAECDNPRALRRCFPWLLTATRAWYEQCGSFESGKETGPSRLTSLTMKYFRNSMDRTLELESSDDLFVVHGRNGSGKSSLSEALELVMTGKLRRLEPESSDSPSDRPAESYLDVLRNRAAPRGKSKFPTELEVKLEKGTNAGLRFPVTPEGVGLKSPGSGALPAAAFLLDERLTDELSLGSPGDRAALLLQAFTENAGEAIAARPAALAQRRDILTTLPAGFPGDSSAYDLSKIPRDADVPLSAKAIFGSWPGGEALRQGLALRASDRLRSWLNGKRGRKRVDLLPLFEEIDRVWDRLASTAEVDAEQWALLVQRLEGLNRWAPHAGQVERSQQQLQSDLDGWLEQSLLANLLSKQQEVSSTVSAASSMGYALPKSALLAFRKSEEKKFSRAEEELVRYQQRGDVFAARLEKARYEGAAAADDDEGIGLLTRDDIDLINKAATDLGLRLPADSDAASVGDWIASIRRSEQAVAIPLVGYSVSEVVVGKRGSLAPVVKRARATMEAMHALKDNQELLKRDKMAPRFAEVVGQLERLAHAEDVLRQIDEVSIREFEALVGGGEHEGERVSLRDAINELLALMTPARWAYQDLLTEARLTGEQQEWGFEVESGGAARLSLNTAELNASSVALFLLCAIQKRNWLRTLIMDDPLQNMDEMTVTATARASSKLMLLWRDLQKGKATWRLGLLVHGEENVERLRAETVCGTYRLPWLSPAGTKGRAGKIDDRIDRLGPLTAGPFMSLAPELGAINGEERRKVVK